MHALLVMLVGCLAVSAVLAAITKFFSGAAILGILAVLPLILRHRKKISIIIRTMPRDAKFLYRYVFGILASKRWSRQNRTVAGLFMERAAKYPDNPCFICEGKVWTFKDVEEYSNKVAQVFQDAGLKRGDVVCLFHPNNPEFVCNWLGLSKLGVITALVNSGLRHKPLLHCINVAKAKAVIFHEDLAADMCDIEESLDNVNMYCLGNMTGGGKIPANSINYRKLLNNAPNTLPIVADPPGYKDCLVYIYTSGTTGMPKAAVMPNSKYLLVVAATFHMLGLKNWENGKKGDILYNTLPLYHLAGGVVGIGTALVEGIPTVIRPKFSASNFWTDCNKYNCTVVQYIGEMCRYLLTQPAKPTDSQHSVRIMVGNGMRAAIWQQIVDRFKIAQINEVYGATEGNANIINVDNKVGAVGFVPSLLPKKLHPVSIIKVDENNVPIRGPDGLCIRCGPNEVGMFIGLVSTVNAAREYHGYINKEESSKKLVENVFSHGDRAFISGDLFMMDEMGYFYFKDRTGDTFKWKGENVSTDEIEGIISHMLGEKACIVYGVSIPMVEGRAGMVAIANSSEKPFDLNALATLVDKSLPSYARPLFLRVMKNIEMTGTFKLKKITYQKQGFDPDITEDAIYFRSGNKPWEKVTTQMYQDICYGRVKL